MGPTTTLPGLTTMPASLSAANASATGVSASVLPHVANPAGKLALSVGTDASSYSTGAAPNPFAAASGHQPTFWSRHAIEGEESGNLGISASANNVSALRAWLAKHPEVMPEYGIDDIVSVMARGLKVSNDIPFSLEKLDRYLQLIQTVLCEEQEAENRQEAYDELKDDLNELERFVVAADSWVKERSGPLKNSPGKKIQIVEETFTLQLKEIRDCLLEVYQCIQRLTEQRLEIALLILWHLSPRVAKPFVDEIRKHWSEENKYSLPIDVSPDLDQSKSYTEMLYFYGTPKKPQAQRIVLSPDASLSEILHELVHASVHHIDRLSLPVEIQQILDLYPNINPADPLPKLVNDLKVSAAIDEAMAFGVQALFVKDLRDRGVPPIYDTPHYRFSIYGKPGLDERFFNLDANSFVAELTRLLPMYHHGHIMSSWRIGAGLKRDEAKEHGIKIGYNRTSGAIEITAGDQNLLKDDTNALESIMDVDPSAAAEIAARAHDDFLQVFFARYQLRLFDEALSPTALNLRPVESLRGDEGRNSNPADAASIYGKLFELIPSYPRYDLVRFEALLQAAETSRGQRQKELFDEARELLRMRISAHDYAMGYPLAMLTGASLIRAGFEDEGRGYLVESLTRWLMLDPMVEKQNYADLHSANLDLLMAIWPRIVTKETASQVMPVLLRFANDLRSEIREVSDSDNWNSGRYDGSDLRKDGIPTYETGERDGDRDKTITKRYVNPEGTYQRLVAQTLLMLEQLYRAGSEMMSRDEKAILRASANRLANKSSFIDELYWISGGLASFEEMGLGNSYENSSNFIGGLAQLMESGAPAEDVLRKLGILEKMMMGSEELDQEDKEGRATLDLDSLVLPRGILDLQKGRSVSKGDEDGDNLAKSAFAKAVAIVSLQSDLPEGMKLAKKAIVEMYRSPARHRSAYVDIKTSGTMFGYSELSLLSQAVVGQFGAIFISSDLMTAEALIELTMAQFKGGLKGSGLTGQLDKAARLVGKVRERIGIQHFPELEMRIKVLKKLLAAYIELGDAKKAQVFRKKLEDESTEFYGRYQSNLKRLKDYAATTEGLKWKNKLHPESSMKALLEQAMSAQSFEAIRAAQMWSLDIALSILSKTQKKSEKLLASAERYVERGLVISANDLVAAVDTAFANGDEAIGERLLRLAINCAARSRGKSERESAAVANAYARRHTKGRKISATPKEIKGMLEETQSLAYPLPIIGEALKNLNPDQINRSGFVNDVINLIGAIDKAALPPEQRASLMAEAVKSIIPEEPENAIEMWETIGDSVDGIGDVLINGNYQEAERILLQRVFKWVSSYSYDANQKPMISAAVMNGLARIVHVLQRRYPWITNPNAFGLLLRLSDDARYQQLVASIDPVMVEVAMRQEEAMKIAGLSFAQADLLSGNLKPAEAMSELISVIDAISRQSTCDDGQLQKLVNMMRVIIRKGFEG